MRIQVRPNFRSVPAWSNSTTPGVADREWGAALKLTVIGAASAGAWLIWGIVIYTVWRVLS